MKERAGKGGIRRYMVIEGSKEERKRVYIWDELETHSPLNNNQQKTKK